MTPDSKEDEMGKAATRPATDVEADPETGADQVAADPAPEPAPAESRSTEYMILRETEGSDGSGEFWEVVGDERATSQSSAVRQFVGEDFVEGVTYLAIPKASWKPKTSKLKTQTSLVLE